MSLKYIYPKINLAFTVIHEWFPSVSTSDEEHDLKTREEEKNSNDWYLNGENVCLSYYCGYLCYTHHYFLFSLRGVLIEMANTVTSILDFDGRWRYPVKGQIQQIHFVKEFWISVEAIQKSCIVVDENGIYQVVNELQGHHYFHFLVNHTLWQDVYWEDVEEAQDILVILFDEKTGDEAYGALDSIYNKISELHQSTVKKVKPQSKVKTKECVKVALDHHSPVFCGKVVLPVNNILGDAKGQWSIGSQEAQHFQCVWPNMTLVSLWIKAKITNYIKLEQELWKSFKEDFVDFVLLNISEPEILDCYAGKQDDSYGEG